MNQLLMTEGARARAGQPTSTIPPLEGSGPPQESRDRVAEIVVVMTGRTTDDQASALLAAITRTASVAKPPGSSVNVSGSLDVSPAMISSGVLERGAEAMYASAVRNGGVAATPWVNLAEADRQLWRDGFRTALEAALELNVG